MTELRDLLHRTADRIADHREAVAESPVFPRATIDSMRTALGGPLPERPVPAGEVIDALAAAAGPGIVGTVGPRYFGFVIGGSTDASLAADLLATGWDQPAYNGVSAPAAAVVEEIAGEWVRELLGLPQGASFGFVTGGQAANNVGLAAARHHVLAAQDWDVEADGLCGAPRVRVVAGAERHATIDRALRLLGFGAAAVESVPADGNGAMDGAALERVLGGGEDGPLIVSAQAGNVNTGACDDLDMVCDLSHERGGWVHVDGAFGLWAAASPSLRHLVSGIEKADSWATDAHKWLNVPYDSGFAFCAHPGAHAAAMAYTAAYLGTGLAAVRSPGDFVPESSRRARGFAVYADVRALGRSGVADLVERCSALARRFATRLSALDGVEVRNAVVLNQVLVSFGDDERTDRVLAAVERDGTCWMGATTWRGRRSMRISVSNWTTTEADVDRSVTAIATALASVG